MSDKDDDFEHRLGEIVDGHNALAHARAKERGDFSQEWIRMHGDLIPGVFSAARRALVRKGVKVEATQPKGDWLLSIGVGNNYRDLRISADTARNRIVVRPQGEEALEYRAGEFTRERLKDIVAEFVQESLKRIT